MCKGTKRLVFISPKGVQLVSAAARKKRRSPLADGASECKIKYTLEILLAFMKASEKKKYILECLSIFGVFFLSCITQQTCIPFTGKVFYWKMSTIQDSTVPITKYKSKVQNNSLQTHRHIEWMSVWGSPQHLEISMGNPGVNRSDWKQAQNTSFDVCVLMVWLVWVLIGMGMGQIILPRGYLAHSLIVAEFMQKVGFYQK